MKSLAEFLEVEEGQEFQLGDLVLRISKNRVEKKMRGVWSESVLSLNELISYLEKNGITLLPTYSPATVEAAKHDSYRFKYVARDADSSICLYIEKPKWDGVEEYYYGTNIVIDNTGYPEVKPGQCVALSEIIGNQN